jgi:predicted ATP-binding protein involved in virulence
MSTPIVPITKLKIKNFRCVYDATVELDWLTVLIGKNDTGKSTILDALAMLGMDDREIQTRKATVQSEMMSRGKSPLAIAAIFEDGTIIEFTSQPNKAIVSQRPQWISGDARERLRGIGTPYRLHPETLREPAMTGQLEGAPLPFNGEGLADALDRMPHRVFGELLDAYTRRIPYVDEVLCDTPKSGQNYAKGRKEIRFRLTNGEEISSQQASDGAMLVLGFLAIIMDKNPPPLILIEEPENGIHPAQLETLVRSLIDLSVVQNRVQIVMTTHSPYVLDAVPAENIRVVTRDAKEGTKVQRFAELEDVKKKLGIGYSVGEAFVNMADDEVAEPVQ